MKRNGFTLIELLAVIIILGIILTIAVPSITGMLDNVTKSAFESDAKMVLQAAKYAELRDENFDSLTVTKDNLQEKLGLSTTNYSQVNFEKVNNDIKIVIVGTSKWQGLTAYGTLKNMKVVNSEDYSQLKPTITLLGVNPLQLVIGEIYADAGATATDEYGKPISVSVNSDVDTNTIGTYYVTYTAKSKLGYTATARREVIVSNIIKTESIINGIVDHNVPDGDYQLESNGTIYDIELLNILNDTVYSTGTISLGTATADQRMLVVKYHGNLTINSGVTVTATTRKKGMLLYVNGDLTNSGTISMTARGANAAGQDVYLWKNSNNTYEYVPAAGATGGAAKYGASDSVPGISGANGTNRATGGGGSGGVSVSTGNATSGAGAAGTSYSGGTGGGASGRTATSGLTQGYPGSPNGGAGGAGSVTTTQINY
jgi:prepilin-type N-terminal cleavage/methylation domain-containing protein